MRAADATIINLETVIHAERADAHRHRTTPLGPRTQGSESEDGWGEASPPVREAAERRAD